MAPRSTTVASKVDAYREGWSAISQLLLEGQSWSGNERNCAYLNLGDGRFVDASAALGLDALEDGRAVASADLDGDGALDLVFRSRTAPQLRVLRGTRSGPMLSLALRGSDGNTDGIGAVVRVTAGGRTRTRHVSAGEGYLAQSSPTLHFALRAGEEIDDVRVRWPGGAEQTFEVSSAGRFRLSQGGAVESIAGAPTAALAPERSPEAATAEAGARVVLRRALPAPGRLLQRLGVERGSESHLITLWAAWCPHCRAELSEWKAHRAELESAGLRISALNLDEPDARPAARDLFDREYANPRVRRYDAGPRTLDALEALLDHVAPSSGELALPTSLLVDPGGQIQVLYKGSIDLEQLTRDARACSTGNAPRASFRGLWLFGIPRSLNTLVGSLRERGLVDEANFYATLQRQRQRSGR